MSSFTINKEEIGSRLEEFCIKNFSTQKEFADAIGIAPSNLRSIYFPGKSLPGAEILVKLAYLGCDVQWLLTGKGKVPEVKVEKTPYKAIKKAAEWKAFIERKKEETLDTGTQTQSLDIIKPVQIPNFENIFILTDEETEIVEKLRNIPDAVPILIKVLSGLIDAKEGFKKLADLPLAPEKEGPHMSPSTSSE